MKEETKLLLWSWIGTLILFFGSLTGLILKIDHIYLQKEIFELGSVCGMFMLAIIIFVTITFPPIKQKKKENPVIIV